MDPLAAFSCRWHACSRGRRLRAHRPMLDGNGPHGKIPRIARCKPTAKRERGRGDEAVRLRKCAAASREFTSPLSGLPSFYRAQRGDSKPRKERTSRRESRGSESTNRPLDVNGAHAGSVPGTAEGMQPSRRLRSAAEEVDEDRRVEEDRRHLPDAALVGTPLLANPP